jgi:hypothetical protein
MRQETRRKTRRSSGENQQEVRREPAGEQENIRVLVVCDEDKFVLLFSCWFSPVLLRVLS